MHARAARTENAIASEDRGLAAAESEDEVGAMASRGGPKESFVGEY
jgi:hypothetical protein